MAESREDAQAEILQGEADVDETAVAQGDEVPPSAGTASESPLTVSSWGPPELEGYTVHGPGLDDRPRLSWTARHAGADLYFIDVRFAGESRQSIGPLPAGDVVQHIAKREAQARRAYDEIAARFSGSASIKLRPAALESAESPWRPAIAIPAAAPQPVAPAEAAEPHPEPETSAYPAATDVPPEATSPTPMSVVAPERFETATTAMVESAMVEPAGDSQTAAAAAPPGKPAPMLLRASGIISTSEPIRLTLRAKPPAWDESKPAAAAATVDTASADTTSTDSASTDTAPIVAAPPANAPPAASGAKSMLRQSIARASQLLHAPKLSLKVVRAQTTTVARPAPTADPEAGKSAGTPAPPAGPAAPPHPASDDRVLRDIEEVLTRQP